MKRHWMLSPLGAIAALVFVAALLALFLGSSGLQAAGLVVAILVAVLAAAGGGLTRTFTARGRITPRGEALPGTLSGPEAPPPETVDANPEATEADWERERQAYRAKQRDEG